jgi:hypothetical protein
MTSAVTETGIVYSATSDALLTALSYHLYTDTPENVPFLDRDGDGQVTTYDLLLVLGQYSTPEGLLILNDYLQCFEGFSGCSYTNLDSNTYVEGEFYYIVTADGDRSCYRYEGEYSGCSITPIDTTSINDTGYDDCQECLDDNLTTDVQVFTVCNTRNIDDGTCSGDTEDIIYIIPNEYGWVFYEFNNIQYQVPQQIHTVCDLSTLKDSDTVVTSESFPVTITGSDSPDSLTNHGAKSNELVPPL